MTDRFLTRGFVISDMSSPSRVGQECRPDFEEDLFLIECQHCPYFQLCSGEMVQDWIEAHKPLCTARSIAFTGRALPPEDEEKAS